MHDSSDDRKSTFLGNALAVGMIVFGVLAMMSPSGKPHLFAGRVGPDDGTTLISIAEDRPWRRSGGKPPNGQV
jgi:hypothetical protein